MKTSPTPADVVMQPVQSSAIEAIGHHASSNTMFVKWKSGHCSAHDDCPHDKYLGLLTSKSKGGHFHAHIKHAHPGRSV